MSYKDILDEERRYYKALRDYLEREYSIDLTVEELKDVLQASKEFEAEWLNE